MADMAASLEKGAQVALLVDTQAGVERHGPCSVIEAGKAGAGGGERILIWTPNRAYRLWVYRSELEPW